MKVIEKKHIAERHQLESRVETKTEEHRRVEKELNIWQTKYAMDSTAWLTTNEKLERHLFKFQKLYQDTEKHIREKESIMGELKREKQAAVEKLLARERELVEQGSAREKELLSKSLMMERELKSRLQQRDEEVKKYMATARENESLYLNEKQERMRLEVAHAQLSSVTLAKEEDLQMTRTALVKRESEVEELLKVKENMTEARKDLDALNEREKQYLDEIHHAHQREVALSNQLDEMTLLRQKLCVELERFKAENTGYRGEVDRLREVEARMRIDLEESRKRETQRLAEYESLLQKERRNEQDLSKLKRDMQEANKSITELRSKNNEYTTKLHEARQTIQSLQSSTSTTESAYRREREELSTEKQQLMDALQQKQAELADLRQQVAEMQLAVDSEVASKVDFHNRSKESLVMVQDKISSLQSTLHETQSQISYLRETEAQLKLIIRQHEETIDDQVKKITSLQTLLAEEQVEKEAIKGQKREGLLLAQEKLIQASDEMEAEVASIRSAFEQNQAQLGAVTEELSRLKDDNVELKALRVKLEGRVAELSTLETSHQDQLKLLSSTLKQRDEEVNILILKTQNLQEQIRRLEEEVNIHQHLSLQKDGELQRLQTNVTGLSRRLKSQVELLIGDQSISLEENVALPEAPVVATRSAIAQTLLEKVAAAISAETTDPSLTPKPLRKNSQTK